MVKRMRIMASIPLPSIFRWCPWRHQIEPTETDAGKSSIFHRSLQDVDESRENPELLLKPPIDPR